MANNKFDWKVAGSAAFAVIIVGTGVFTSLSMTNHVKYMSEAKAEVETLEGDINDINNSEVFNKEEMAADLGAAAEYGKAVADLQNKYNSVNTDESMDEYKQVAEDLDKYLGEDDKGARVQWFDASKGDAKLTWSFKSTYAYTGSTLDVVWLCSDDANGEVVAYATAKFNSDDNLFTDVEYKTTTAANKHVDKTDTDVESELKETIDDIKDAESDYEAPEGSEMTPEELAELRKQQEELKEKLKDKKGDN